jgi:hypothetical protein
MRRQALGLSDARQTLSGAIARRPARFASRALAQGGNHTYGRVKTARPAASWLQSWSRWRLLGYAHRRNIAQFILTATSTTTRRAMSHGLCRRGPALTLTHCTRRGEPCISAALALAPTVLIAMAVAESRFANAGMTLRRSSPMWVSARALTTSLTVATTTGTTSRQTSAGLHGMCSRGTRRTTDGSLTPERRCALPIGRFVPGLRATAFTTVLRAGGRQPWR